MNLTEHFTAEELVTSGKHPEIDNSLPEKFDGNRLKVAELLEEARAILTEYYGEDTPIHVKYAWRGSELNKACGGERSSAHLEMLAADTYYTGHESSEVAQILFEHPTFMKNVDQLIIERGCLHYGLPCAASAYQARRELRKDAWVNGERHYPLIAVWRSPHD
jgi:hypothetical protein